MCNWFRTWFYICVEGRNIQDNSEDSLIYICFSLSLIIFTFALVGKTFSLYLNIHEIFFLHIVGFLTILYLECFHIPGNNVEDIYRAK